MPVSVKRYTYICVTENRAFGEWRESPPTCCINDSDQKLGHKINEILVTDEINNSSMYIEGKAYDKATGGYYCLKGDTCNVSSTSVTTKNITFDIPMCIYSINFMSGPENKGDFIDILYNPDIIIGTITKPVNINDNVINVSNTVIQYMQLGFYFVITDGSTYDEIGMVIKKDELSGTIQLDSKALKAYDAARYVAIRVYMVRNYQLQDPCMHKIGKGVSGSKLMEKDSIIQLRYNNRSGLEKTFIYSYECIY
jgi:hypothetical protein